MWDNLQRASPGLVTDWLWVKANQGLDTGGGFGGKLHKQGKARLLLKHTDTVLLTETPKADSSYFLYFPL